jgi:hypothetical protein
MAATGKHREEFRERSVRRGRCALHCGERDGRARGPGGAGPLPPDSSWGDAADVSDVLHMAADPSSRNRTEAVRRRVLVAQLARLAERAVDTDPASLDAAARCVRLASRLEHNDLAW